MSAVLPIVEDPRFRLSTAVGGETSYTVPFPFQDNDDVTLVRFAVDGTPTLQIEGTHYTLTGHGDPAGGTATIFPAMVAGEKMLRMGSTVLDRLESVVRDGRFASLAIDEDIDRWILIAQELKRDIGQAVRMPLGTSIAELPAPAAGKYWKWSDDGLHVQFVDLVVQGALAVSAFGAQLLAETTAALARTRLGLGLLAVKDKIAASDHLVPQRMAISGLKPDKLSTNVLRIYEGNVYSSDGALCVQNATYYDINMATVGVGGLDTGTPTEEYDYFVYVLRRNSDGAFAAVISHSITYGGVALPSGYTHVRKLRFGFRYRAAWDGIPNHDAMEWPWPHVRLTNAEATSTFRTLSAGASTSFATVQFNGMVPDNARVVDIMVRVNCGAAAGTGYIRSPGSGQLTGIEFACEANGTYTTYTTIRVNSTLDLEYKVTNDVTMTIWLLGFHQTEPS